MKFSTILLALAGGAITFGSSPASAEKLTFGLASETTSMDPYFHNVGPNNALLLHIYDRLIRQDERQQLSPGLALSWKPIDDLTWEFKLREGVKFHDGTDFNADDVVCSFERAPNVPDSPSSFATYVKGKSVVKVDDYTVHFKTETPYPLMGNDVSTVAIVSDSVGCGAATADYNSGAAAIGTGPFMFGSYTPGESVVLKKNPNYWDGAAEWDQVEFRPIASNPSRVAALLAGDVDVISGVPTTDIVTLRNNDAVELHQGPSNRVIYLHLDQFRENSPFIKALDGSDIKNPLLDVRVRKAISKAINRDAIVEHVMEGVAIPAGQLMPSGFFGVSENLQPETYDPDGAKALLAEAGYGDGFQMTIHGPNDRYINDAKIAEAIGQMLTRVGIQMSVETMPRSVYFKRASSGSPEGTPEFSFILVGWGAGSGEASSPLKSLIHTFDKEKGFGSSNRGRHSDAAIDAVIEEALATVDDAKRQDLLAKATEMAMETQAIIPTHFQVNTWGTRKGLSYIPRTDEYTVVMSVKKD
ncbi:ABC transporter substrate-binding protein [uncultured Ruegeria sp.]|uniref:ABC transporter substrate-binding protein n=1 Tax=uncultured Ruegeria sp. TaxID=259304 RepID=UPI0026108706|nr:ABC transporter substrate-binding protein [uncultured Ruegeria sp.]